MGAHSNLIRQLYHCYFNYFIKNLRLSELELTKKNDREEPLQPFPSDPEDYYEDMIACSPASSLEDNNKSKKKKEFSETDELLDEDISQYEFDSFKSMMAVAANTPTPSPGKPIDKASVRRYCTHEADNAYRCNVCGKTYTHISNFCRHFLSTHHGMKPEIPCPVCFKLFTRKDNMMTHTKQVHRLTLHRGTLQPIPDPPPEAFPPL